MLGIIFKLIAAFVIVVGGTLVGLNASGVAKPGTISVHAPDAAPCRQAVAQSYPDRPAEYVEVRWVWQAHGYGWGCFFEFEDATTGTIAPMP